MACKISEAKREGGIVVSVGCPIRSLGLAASKAHHGDGTRAKS